jgi:hypothetical protein
MAARATNRRSAQHWRSTRRSTPRRGSCEERSAGTGRASGVYLLGHTDAKFTMRVYQHVLDVGSDTARQLEQLLGAGPEDAVIHLSGRAHWASIGPGAEKTPPRKRVEESPENEKPGPGAGFAQVAEGTRTLDLLHGNQYADPSFPAVMRGSRPDGCRRITVDYRGFGQSLDSQTDRRCRRASACPHAPLDGTKRPRAPCRTRRSQVVPSEHVRSGHRDARWDAPER